jgi:hypothetical protein
VVAEWLDDKALPQGVRKNKQGFVQLAEVYKQLNAPLGELGRSSLVLANRSVTGTDKTYERYLETIGGITSERDQIAGQIRTALDAAAFGGKPVNEFSELGLDIRARLLIDSVNLLAGHERHNED